MSIESDGGNIIISSTLERGFAGAGLIGIAGVCLFVGLVNPSVTSLLPPCPLLTLTGFACPGCGLTRGFHALFQGDVMTALDFNALIPFYVIGAFYLVVLLIRVLIKGRGLPFNSIHPAVLLGFLVVSVVFGVIRNIPGYPFSVLFP